jgi:hypothetical protein
MVGKVSLKEIIDAEREQKFVDSAKNFYCQDDEVENFLKEKALEFDKRNKSRTYLLIDEDNSEDIVIWGYYTLTLKSLKYNPDLSKSKIKKIDGFRGDATEAESTLIGQLGKNYNYKDKISGFEIIEYAMDDIYEIQRIVGGRVAFLECNNTEKILKFYEDNGFIFLQSSGAYIQMIRYL